MGLLYFKAMKHFRTLLFALAVLALASCGTDGGHFRIEGRLLNLNQGEFYVYSPDGDMRGLDTIRVQAGRFTYTTECTSPKTLMIVFPNFTQQPVFAQPGKSVDIKGDASHLKEMTVKGTKANELMNTFREKIRSASPPEVLKHASQTAADHPESPVAAYLVYTYFMNTPTPDFATASRLLGQIAQAQPDNTYVKRLKAMADGRPNPSDTSLPRFTATDIDGRTVSDATLREAPATLVIAWASWNYSSMSMLRQAAQRAATMNGRLKVVGICLDPSPQSCRRTLRTSQIEGAVNICDGRMAEGQLYNRLGMYNLPDNILIKNGRIAERNLSTSTVLLRIDQL